MMRYLSVCSGIEAATQAWHPLGWQPVAFSEIEPFPSAVLAHHYPSVPNLGDMTKFKEWPNEPIDLLVGGTPCQSFSVAGLRKGLADPRGNLALTYLAIAEQYQPRWIIWENVPGVLSSNGGRDFGAFLGGLGQLGYGFAYRVLDAQYCRTRRFPWAVPQRRRRVFVVGYLGDWRLAASAMFDRPSFGKTLPPRRAASRTWAFDNGLSEQFNMPVGLGISPTLIKTRGYCICDGSTVRKMTPVEAERLQGFPDGFTAIHGEKTSESARFAAIGNSMAVNVMDWLGERIALVEQMVEAA